MTIVSTLWWLIEELVEKHVYVGYCDEESSLKTSVVNHPGTSDAGRCSISEVQNTSNHRSTPSLIYIFSTRQIRQK